MPYLESRSLSSVHSTLEPQLSSREKKSWIQTFETEHGFEGIFEMKLTGIGRQRQYEARRLLRLMSKSIEAITQTMEEGQRLEIIYPLNTKNNSAMPFLIKGHSVALSEDKATSDISTLFKSCTPLRTECGLQFEMVNENKVEMAFKSRWDIQPQGFLLSQKQDKLAVVKSKGSFDSIELYRPYKQQKHSSLYDVLSLVTESVNIIISLEPVMLSDIEHQTITKLVDRRLDCRVLPERFKTSDIDMDVLKAELRKWLFHPRGVCLGLTVESNEKISLSSQKLLASAFYPEQAFTFSENLNTKSQKDSASLVNLSSCFHNSQEIPQVVLDVIDLQHLGVVSYYENSREILATEGISLGSSGDQEVLLTQEDRARHVYIVGASGSGKSTLIHNMLLQDMRNGEGVCLLDPHGDLYQSVLESVPESRVDDVIAIDLGNFEHTIGLNFLEATGDHKKLQYSFITNEMMKIFDRLYNMKEAGGPMFELYMRNSLLLLMENSYPGTLLDVPLIFESKAYRHKLMETCTNPSVIRFWRDQAEEAMGEASLESVSPYITSKLNQFTHNALLRPIIGQQHSTLDFGCMIEQKKIVLINLSKGLLGEMDTQLIGMLLIGKLFNAALKRSSIAAEKRHPFFLYIDEFQNFTTNTVAHMLSESRKFGLHLVLANQYLGQVSDQGQDGLMQSIMGNVSNFLMYRMGVVDANILETYTKPELDSQALQYLPDYHVCAKMIKNSVASEPSFKTNLAGSTCLLFSHIL